MCLKCVWTDSKPTPKLETHVTLSRQENTTGSNLLDPSTPLKSYFIYFLKNIYFLPSIF